MRAISLINITSDILFAFLLFYPLRGVPVKINPENIPPVLHDPEAKLKEIIPMII